jgi:hypothetical protein
MSSREGPSPYGRAVLAGLAGILFMGPPGRKGKEPGRRSPGFVTVPPLFMAGERCYIRRWPGGLLPARFQAFA